jgi:hypothetical protein
MRILREEGFDAARLCSDRRRHVLQKWSSVRSISDGPLRSLR